MNAPRLKPWETAREAVEWELEFCTLNYPDLTYEQLLSRLLLHNGKFAPEDDSEADTRLPLADIEAMARVWVDEQTARPSSDTEQEKDATSGRETFKIDHAHLFFLGKQLRHAGHGYAHIHAALTAANARAARVVPAADIDSVMEMVLRGNKGFPQTETGDAEFFAAVYGDVVRFNHLTGRWLLLDEASGIWEPDGTERVRTLVTDLMRMRQRNALYLADEPKKKAMAWALSGESQKRIDNTLKGTRSLAPISDDGASWDQQRYLLGTPTGVVDLRTGELRKGRPDEHVSMRVDAPFQGLETPAPQFEAFLRQVFQKRVNPLFDLEGNDLPAELEPDTEMIAYVQRALGYSTSADVFEEKLFINIGGGGNGKSTLLYAVSQVLGDYAAMVPFSALETAQRPGDNATPELVKLVGKRFAVASETKEGRRLSTERIKSWTGGEKLPARQLYEAAFDFMPHFHLWLMMNPKPRLEDDSDALWRRVQMIHYLRSFKDNPDITLKGRLVKEEGPGILAWLVRGCLEWQRIGLQPPASVTEAVTELRDANDLLADFIDECCYVGDNAKERSGVLLAAYRKWANAASRHEFMNNTRFGLLMKKRFKPKKMQGYTWYLGVTLLEQFRIVDDSKARTETDGPEKDHDTPF